MKNLILLIISIFLTIGVFAQEAISIERYRELVLEYSQSLKIKTESIKKADSNLDVVKTGYLPSLHGEANSTYSFHDQSIKYPSAAVLKDFGYYATLNIQQNVYAGGTVRAGVKSAKISKSISDVQYEVTFQDIAYSSDISYWSYSAAIEAQQIGKKYVEIVQGLYDILKERYDDGYVSKIDLLMVESQLYDAKQRYTNIEREYNNAVNTFNTLMGTSKNQEYSLYNSIYEIAPYEDITSVEEELENNPEYREAMLNIDFNKQMKKVTRSQYNPQFVIGAKGGYISAASQSAPPTYGQVFASLNIPIFMWGERRKKIAMIETDIRSSEENLSLTKDNIKSSVLSTKTNLVKYSEQVEVVVKSLNVAEETLELNTFSYNEGNRSILDVLQSQISWLSSYVSYVNTSWQYQISIAEYKKANGQY
ncbi:MAG: TolC family protein [Bacteroidetes bacterium]|nr:TolC family protein [Bacteroidota bacterium]